jgi:lysozyme family protein
MVDGGLVETLGTHPPPDVFTTRALPWILYTEGGFSDVPEDGGGPTNLGVSLRAVKLRDHDRDGQLDFDLDRDGDVDVDDIRLMTVPAAARLYRESYWSLGGSGTPATCDDFPAGIALALFDASVNSGPRAAVAFLQRGLGVKADGLAGPVTIRQAWAAPVGGLLRSLTARLEFMRGRKNAPTFFRGWSRRVLELEAYIGPRFVLPGPKA